jgi:Uncharacterized protein conserved in bacteria (DUF2255)
LEDAAAEEVEFRAAVHLPFQHFDSVDLALDRAGAPGQGHPAVTAARSRCRPFANECSGGSSPASTAAIHCGSRAPRPDWSSPEAARSAGDEFYVHSARGPANPWFGRALRNGTGRIRAGDLERDVIFAAADPDAHTDIDAAYHAKYDRYGAAIVGSVVGEKARAVTIRLVPRA